MGDKQDLSAAGLSSAEAVRRLKTFGENVVATKKRLRPIVAFLKKFNSPLLLILIAVSIISFFIGERTNAIILVFMVFLSVTLDFVNTFRSEGAVKALIARVVTTATVVRDGRQQELRLQEIVPGDVVVLTAGDIVPADSVITSSKDLFVNQSVLTGESLPVEKSHAGQPPDPDRLSATAPNVVFMGTSVVSGYATIVALQTGKRTAFGKIAERLTEAERETDFERNIKKFSLFIMRLTFILVGLVFLINTLADRGWFESFIFAIAIAVGLTPELLPVILSVSLSRGAVRMSKQEVIVKHLPAIQNFGRMNILCTDKTGTLTENRITVVKFVDGYGETSDDVLRTAYMSSAFHSGVPNPLDQAVREYRSWDLAKVKKIDEIPFDFERRRDSIVVDAGGSRELITKGAPEGIFPICTSAQRQGQAVSFDESFRRTSDAQFASLSQEGYKVLAVASRKVEGSKAVYEKDEERGMAFLGFVAFLDPPKADAKEAIDALENLGVEMKILTGDSALLTEKICREIDLPTKGTVTGEEIVGLADDKLQQLALRTTIFARIDPEQKERIITCLMQAGQVVGYLGDGINDAPALKAADVGVSVNNAVDVAKETADIILLRKSLNALADGVREGRKTFRNTLKYIMMGMSSNFGNMFSMMVASAFLPFLPMLPTQVLLNNFLYDVSQLSLSTDAVDEAEVKSPTPWDMKFIRRFMLVFGSISSIFDFVTFGALYFVFRLGEHQFQAGWFIESIATQVFVIYVIRTRKIPFLQSRPSRWLTASTLAAVALAWAIPFSPFGRSFGLTPLPLSIVATIVAIVLAYLVLVEIAKRIFYRRFGAVRAERSLPPPAYGRPLRNL